MKFESYLIAAARTRMMCLVLCIRAKYGGRFNDLLGAIYEYSLPSLAAISAEISETILWQTAPLYPINLVAKVGVQELQILHITTCKYNRNMKYIAVTDGVTRFVLKYPAAIEFGIGA